MDSSVGERLTTADTHERHKSERQGRTSRCTRPRYTRRVSAGVGRQRYRMSEIERILRSGESHRELVAVPSTDELSRVSNRLGVVLPPSYIELCQLGGLGELRFNHRILRPAEMMEARGFVPRENLLPFADNGCGDLYCWLMDGSSEPAVVFFDHEERTETTAAASFTAWLAANRF